MAPSQIMTAANKACPVLAIRIAPPSALLEFTEHLAHASPLPPNGPASTVDAPLVARANHCCHPPRDRPRAGSAGRFRAARYSYKLATANTVIAPRNDSQGCRPIGRYDARRSRPSREFGGQHAIAAWRQEGT